MHAGYNNQQTYMDMDPAHLARPSPEWTALAAANPHLRINDISDPEPGFPSPIDLRDAANAAKVVAVRSQLAQTGLDQSVSRTEYRARARDGVGIPLRVYRSVVRPYTEDSIAAEKLVSTENPPAVFIYLHGGGMLLGNLDTEDLNCCVWADLLGPDFVVVSVNYRHTPEHVFPTQQNDAWDAFCWIGDNASQLEIDPDRIVVGGISSGGCLAAEVVLREVSRTREKGDMRIRGQVLAMPWLVHRDVYPRDEKGSLVQCRAAPIMPAARYDLFTNLLGDGDGVAQGFSVGLVDDKKLIGVPRTSVVACGWDMLRDEAFAFAERLEDMGTPLKKHVFPGLPHAFTKYQNLPSSKRFNDLMAESIRWCLSDEKADEPGRWRSEMAGEYSEAKADKRVCWSWTPLFGRWLSA